MLAIVSAFFFALCTIVCVGTTVGIYRTEKEIDWKFVFGSVAGFIVTAMSVSNV